MPQAQKLGTAPAGSLAAAASRPSAKILEPWTHKQAQPIVRCAQTSRLPWECFRGVMLVVERELVHYVTLLPVENLVKPSFDYHGA